MNLKYYLRGLGIGIVVTAFIMGVATRGKGETISNEEIKERAKALGMIEDSVVLADSIPENSEELLETPSPTEAPVETAQPSEEPVETAQPTEKPIEKPQPTPQPTKEPVVDEKPLSDSVVIVVKNGESSYHVCKKLEEAGLVESASEFDMFLDKNGYDKRINAGTFEIPSDADQEKVAKILTNLE